MFMSSSGPPNQVTAPPNYPFRTPQLPSNRDHKRLNEDTAGVFTFFWATGLHDSTRASSALLRQHGPQPLHVGDSEHSLRRAVDRTSSPPEKGLMIDKKDLWSIYLYWENNRIWYRAPIDSFMWSLRSCAPDNDVRKTLGPFCNSFMRTEMGRMLNSDNDPTAFEVHLSLKASLKALAQNPGSTKTMEMGHRFSGPGQMKGDLNHALLRWTSGFDRGCWYGMCIVTQQVSGCFQVRSSLWVEILNWACSLAFT